MVSYLGSSYVALVDGVTTTPVAGASWGVVASSGEGAISSLFEDSMPKLSNNLDMNGFTLVNSSIDITKASLDKSFQANEAYLLTLDNSQDCAIVNVQKEEPQLGVENRLWNTAVNPYTFEVPNEAYSDSLTITDLYEEVTLTLATLNWSTDDVGKYIKVASGACYITDVNAKEAYGKVIDTINTGTYNAGEWEMYSATFTEDELTLAYGVTSGEGFDIEAMEKTKLLSDTNTSYTLSKDLPSPFNQYNCIAIADGKLYTNHPTHKSIYQWNMPQGFIHKITATNPDKTKAFPEMSGAFSFTFADDGKRLYCVDHTNGKVFQYSLTIPYDIATIAYTNKSFTAYYSGSVVYQSISMSSNGKYLYIHHSGDFTIRRYELSIPYDIVSTRTLTSTVLNTMYYSDTGTVNIQRATISDNGRELMCASSVYQSGGGNYLNAFSIPLSVAYDITTIPSDKRIQQIGFALESNSSSLESSQLAYYKGKLYLSGLSVSMSTPMIRAISTFSNNPSYNIMIS